MWDMNISFFPKLGGTDLLQRNDISIQGLVKRFMGKKEISVSVIVNGSYKQLWHLTIENPNVKEEKKKIKVF